MVLLIQPVNNFRSVILLAHIQVCLLIRSTVSFVLYRLTFSSELNAFFNSLEHHGNLIFSYARRIQKNVPHWMQPTGTTLPQWLFQTQLPKLAAWVRPLRAISYQHSTVTHELQSLQCLLPGESLRDFDRWAFVLVVVFQKWSFITQKTLVPLLLNFFLIGEILCDWRSHTSAELTVSAPCYRRWRNKQASKSARTALAASLMFILSGIACVTGVHMGVSYATVITCEPTRILSNSMVKYFVKVSVTLKSPFKSISWLTGFAFRALSSLRFLEIGHLVGPSFVVLSPVSNRSSISRSTFETEG